MNEKNKFMREQLGILINWFNPWNSINPIQFKPINLIKWLYWIDLNILSNLYIFLLIFLVN